MITTDKTSCQAIADLLVMHGVKRAVLCPGSRNAPLIVAISRHPGIDDISVVDERSAAFMALGMAVESGQPVAIVCTSGTAVLNFAPAVAEAFYRQVPLVVISADRPEEWIDQDDSQTIRQAGVLTNITKGCWDIPVETGDPTQAWYINRAINDTLLQAVAAPCGPVHINVQLDAPLGKTAQASASPTPIRCVSPDGELPAEAVADMARQIHQAEKVLIVAGFMAPDPEAIGPLYSFLTHKNVALLCEAQSNLRIDRNIDSMLSCMTADEKESLKPDIVITLGGSLVSRFIKAWLRGSDCQHWHVGFQPYSVDCFMHLTTRIAAPTATCLRQLASALENYEDNASTYSQAWRHIEKRSIALDHGYAYRCPWSDYMAMRTVMRLVKPDTHLHLSNGTAVRYAQLFPYSHIARIDCNRGVSGIDGCTSTALGASIASGAPTLLVSGDMSAQYDVGALAFHSIPTNFKMAVLCNGGGGIFRFIDTTASLPEREKYFCAQVRLPIADLARAYGFEYFEASSEKSLSDQWQQFMDAPRPAIMAIVTDPAISADCLRNYFEARKPQAESEA